MMVDNSALLSTYADCEHFYMVERYQKIRGFIRKQVKTVNKMVDNS